jgi:hypothetical protein
MKKVKLKESDIENLVKKIIKEEQMEIEFGDEGHSQDEMNEVWRELNRVGNSGLVSRKLYDFDFDDMMEATFNEGSMSVENFVNNLPTLMFYERDYLVSVLKQIQDEGI